MFGLDYAQNRYYSPQIARFTTADPYQASGGPADPQSWNRYSYVQNDPINYFDPGGTMRVKPCSDLDPSYGTCLPEWIEPFRGGRGTIGPPVVVPPQKTAYPVARKLQDQVKTGRLTDCEALADFADNIAEMTSGNDAFIEAFGVLIPKQLASQYGGIPWNTNYVRLNTGQSSGFASQYQNTTPDGRTGDPGWNGDQGHHFAAFFAYGYNHPDLGTSAALWFEVVEGFLGTINQGDIELGAVAAQMGAALKANIRSASEIGGLIRDVVCAQ